MSLSRPIYDALGFYFMQLYSHPVRTKAITSCVIATSANYTTQKIAGCKKIDQNSIFAYGLFGLIFGGTLPHYFYTWTEKLIPDELRIKKVLQFMLERCAFAPIYQAISLYMLSRFEGKGHDASVENMMKLYWPILKANWKFLSTFIFINFALVPPMLRVFIANIIGFFWVVFIGLKRRKAQAAAEKKEKDM